MSHTEHETSEAGIRAVVREFLRDNFLYMRPDLAFGDDDPLLARGVIDSLGVMELVGFVEERWHIVVETGGITEDHFGSVAAIARYVAALRGAPSAAGAES